MDLTFRTSRVRYSPPPWDQPVTLMLAVGVAGERGVEFEVEGQARGEGVGLAAGEVGVELVLDDHPLHVAAEEIFGCAGEVVGDQQGREFVADVADRDLA